MATELASDIVVSGAKLYYSAVGTTLPAVTVPVDGAWPAGWTYCAYTLDPVKVGYKFDTLDIMVQQAMNAVSRSRISEELSFETTLAQHGADLIALAMAGSSAAVAAVSGTPGYEDFYVGGDYALPIKQWGIEGSYVSASGNKWPIRIFIWKATTSEGGELEYDRTKPAGIPLKIKALEDSTRSVGQRLMRIQRVTAAALP